LATLVDITPRLEQRRTLANRELAAAIKSQRAYLQLVRKAAAARREDFERALASGVDLEELAAAVGLEVEDVEEIVGT
jgi:hypothetical protein